MCIHETIQLSQDGERVIVCGDCGREFAKIADDENETLVVPVEQGRTVVALNGDLTTADKGLVLVTDMGDVGGSGPIYPCRRCGFSMSCPKVENEDCHT